MKRIFASLVLSLFGLFLVRGEVFAQTLSFEPTQKGVAKSGQFTVKININTSGQQTSGADAVITYDPAVLTVESVSSGGFYSNFGSNPVEGASNKYGINAFETDSTSTKTGTGTIAQIVFTGKEDGTSSVTFDCTAGSTTDSNIIKAGTADDIINCTNLVSASYTVGGGGSDGGDDGGNGINPTTTVLPRSGAVEVTILGLGLGVVVTLLGLLLKI